MKERGRNPKRLLGKQEPLFKMVPMTGIELVTYALRVRCSTN